MSKEKVFAFVLDASVHLHLNNHEFQSWHRPLLECRGRTSSMPCKAGFSDMKEANTFYWYINQHNIRIWRESAELWRLNDPEVSRLAETRQKKWVWMNQGFARENSFELSIRAWFSLWMACFSLSVVTHRPETVPNMARTLTHHFLQSTWSRRLIFEYISIIKCLTTQFVNSNSSTPWLTRFDDDCICVNSILRSWADREVPHQSR
jgi:hypothetical protein